MPIVKARSSLAEAVNDKGVLLDSYYRMNLRLVCSPRAAHWADCLQRCSVSGICNILMIIDNQEITRPGPAQHGAISYYRPRSHSRLCYSRYRTIADRSRGAPIPEPDGRLRGSGASHPALFALPLLVRLLRLTLSHKLMFALTVQLLIPMLCHVSCISLKFSRR